MSVEVIDGVPYTNVLLNVRSPDNAHMLMLHLQDVDRDKLTGAYTFEKKQVRSGRYVDKGDTELESMLFTVDGRVDVSLVDAMMFPPTYRYDIELYVLSHTKSRAWNEHRELYTISHPDDAIYLSGSVTLQPEFTCELGKTKWTWLINESGGAGFIPTQPSYEVEPKCLEFAGVDLR